MRIQWDPERSLLLAALDHRTIQVGLGGEAARLYVNEWTLEITDVTSLAQSVHALVAAGELTAATDNLPVERPYPLSQDLKKHIGAT